jgi:hypothetical protein
VVGFEHLPLYQDASFGAFDKLADERFEGLFDVLADKASEMGDDNEDVCMDEFDG